MASNVLLILGAGASFDFKFPLGADLTEKIWSLDAEVINRAIQSADSGKTHAFLTRLKSSGQDSIDAFVALNPEFDLQARTAIAHILLRHEAASTECFPPRPGTWCRYLLNRLTERAKTWGSFDPSWLSVITFNYDRSFERCLTLALARSYPGQSETTVMDRLQTMEIHHVYGSLGTLWSGDHCLHYGAGAGGEGFHHAVRQAANNLRLIPDSRNAEIEMESIRDAIRGARRLCFLGFGYDRTNLVERLGAPHTFLVNALEKRIYGTAYNLLEGEIKHAIHLIIGNDRDVEIDLRHLACLDMLRQSQVLSVD